MSMGSENGLGRRDFLKSFAAGGAGLAALGLMGCTKTEIKEATTLPETWDVETDVVVVGFGSAGGAAAYKAATDGADVILLEKMSEELAGGNSCCYAGSYMDGDATDQWITNSLGVMTRDIAEARNTAARAAYQWVASNGMRQERNGFEVTGGAPEYYRIVKKSVTAQPNVTVMYSTPVTGLIQDWKTGEIKGVYAEKDGKEIAVKAKKGVILCSGDYAANPDLVHALHWPKIPVITVGTPAATGDCALMALAAGARMVHANTIDWEWFEFAFRKPSEEMGTGVTSRWQDLADVWSGLDNSPIYDSKIYVNMEGKRFMNEKQMLQHEKSHVAFLDIKGALWDMEKDYINMPFFWVCDDDCFTSAPWGKVQRDQVPWTWANVKGVYTWSDDNVAELNKGWIIKADTIEELAAKMTAKTYMTGKEVTVPAEALKETIAKYNAGCEAGVDEFGRNPERIKPIVKAPFYAIELAPCAIYSLGFLDTDVHGNVVGTDGAAIPRLYAAGNIGQGVSFTPLGIGGCMGMGWNAAINAAAAEPWE